jgi:hypothetical protein
VPAALEVAHGQYVAQQQLAAATAQAGADLWAQVDFANLSVSWGRFIGRLSVILQGAQRAAAQTADSYVDRVLEAQGVHTNPAGRVSSAAFSGVASDGRSLDGLLINPVISAKYAVAQGADRPRALASGAATLDMTLRTQVADAGRVATGVAVAARPRTGYTRMVVGDSCPRCVILAGRFYRYSAGFLRHPRCDCIHIPTVEDVADDVTTNPRAAFEAGRVKGLSKADEQAIRDGADMAQVVNARSGMYVAGGRKLTRAGTTRRGTAGRRLNGAARLMPEEIYREAKSRDEALNMLRVNGYLI